MSPAALLISALIILFAMGMTVWAWLSATQVGKNLCAFGGFETKHFEIGSHATERNEGATWPTRG